MDNQLSSGLEALVIPSLCESDNTYLRVKARIEQGALTRAENEASHFSAYFLPINHQGDKVFLVDHRKSGLWLSPGGHVEPDESVFETLNREAEEELGLRSSFSGAEQPFMLSITPIANPSQACRTHFDVWFLLPTDGSGFQIDEREFRGSKWLDFAEARAVVTDPNTLRALQDIEAGARPDGTHIR